jgi:hypothetical protein
MQIPGRNRYHSTTRVNNVVILERSILNFRKHLLDLGPVRENHTGAAKPSSPAARSLERSRIVLFPNSLRVVQLMRWIRKQALYAIASYSSSGRFILSGPFFATGTMKRKVPRHRAPCLSPSAKQRSGIQPHGFEADQFT